jgi:hypothetical protein
VDVTVDPVLDLAMAAADGLVLIEHGLPHVVVGDSMVNNKGDGHCGPLRVAGSLCAELPDRMFILPGK